jgi:hypothetical protein
MPRTRSAVALAIIAIAGTVGRWPADVPQKGPWFLPSFAVKSK